MRKIEKKNNTVLQNVISNVKMTECGMKFTHLPQHVAGVVVSDGMLRFTGLSSAYKLARLDHNGLNFSASATHTSQKMKQLMEKRSIGWWGFLKEREGR